MAVFWTTFSLLVFLFCCTQVMMNVGCSTENALHLFEWRTRGELFK